MASDDAATAAAGTLRRRASSVRRTSRFDVPSSWSASADGEADGEGCVVGFVVGGSLLIERS
jgi:hypothetical protein